MRLPLDCLQFNPCRPQPSQMELQAMLERMGSLRDWTWSNGGNLAHSELDITGVENLLLDGTQQWTDVPSDFMQEQFPSATPATWWILMQTEARKDLQLYIRLWESLRDYHPTVWSRSFAYEQAKIILKRIGDETLEEDMAEIRRYLTDKPNGGESCTDVASETSIPPGAHDGRH